MHVSPTLSRASAHASQPIVYYFVYKDGGKEAYYFLSTTPIQQIRLESDLKRKPNITLDDYGQVLYSGWGAAPDALKHEMETRFGVVYH